MPVNRVYKFRDIRSAENFLNGMILGKEAALPFSGLVGKTLIFNSPAVTVTFVTPATPVPGDPTAMFFKDIKLQIEAVAATLLVTASDGRLGIIEATPTSGVNLDLTGTANSILGFDTGNDTVSKVYKPSAITTTPPVWVWAETSSAEGANVIYTYE